jgi:hypothetical protein
MAEITLRFINTLILYHLRSVPQFKRAAMNLDGEVEFGAVNCDKASPICQEWGIQSFPKFLLFSPHYEWSGVLLLPPPLLRAAMCMCACVHVWGVYGFGWREWVRKNVES